MSLPASFNPSIKRLVAGVHTLAQIVDSGDQLPALRQVKGAPGFGPDHAGSGRLTDQWTFSCTLHMSRVLLIQGHPDNQLPHLCHALAVAYAEEALKHQHDVKTVDVASLDFPLLRSQKEWEEGILPEGLRDAQDAVGWAEHIVIFFPLWLGDMPALLKGFLEQVMRPGFAFAAEGGRTAFTKKGLTGRSARLVVTMGMPALVYRWFFRAHSVKSLERNILGFVGISSVDETLIGGVGNLSPEAARKWLDRMRTLGATAG